MNAKHSLAVYLSVYLSIDAETNMYTPLNSQAAKLVQPRALPAQYARAFSAQPEAPWCLVRFRV